MSEIRQNIATKEWVIIASERAKRPEEFLVERKVASRPPEYEESCPFCPGNEEMSPVEHYSIKKNGKWSVRVIPNKFPALSMKTEFKKNFNGIFCSIGGAGEHEVVIETPLHNVPTALLTDDHFNDIIRSYRERYLSMSKNEIIKMIVVFKNHGEGAGTSLIHPHSQIVGMPVVPLHIRDRLDGARRYYDENAECVFCVMLREELKAGTRIICENKNFAAFVPYAALGPYHTWILPKKHMSSFVRADEIILKDLSAILKTVLYKLYKGLGNPDFNYVIRSSPTDMPDTDFFHWYVSIVPRITRAAGFEVGSGMFINTCSPEESAEFLRGIK